MKLWTFNSFTQAHYICVTGGTQKTAFLNNTVHCKNLSCSRLRIHYFSCLSKPSWYRLSITIILLNLNQIAWAVQGQRDVTDGTFVSCTQKCIKVEGSWFKNMKVVQRNKHFLHCKTKPSTQFLNILKNMKIVIKIGHF